MSENNITDAASIIKFAESRTLPQLMTVAAGDITAPAYVHPRSGDLQSLKTLVDQWRPHPERRKGTIVASTIESFVALVNRDSNENSVIFADNSDEPKLVAVLNFHAADGGTPAFCDDRIVYSFPLSEEWEAWNAVDGESHKMNQAAFAEFIEDRFFDIGEPGSAGSTSSAWAEKMGVKLAGPQELMRVSRGLSIRVEETVRNVIKRDSGECEFVFTVENKDSADGGTVKVPSAFHIRIPVLRGEGPYSIPVRLRYRAGGGKISWFVELHRPELFLLDAVNAAIQRVNGPEDAADVSSRGCGLLVVMGTPPG